MIEKSKQIKVWRDVVSFEAMVCMPDGEGLRQFIYAVRHALGVEDWSGFELFFQTLARVFLPSRRHRAFGDDKDPAVTERRLRHAIEVGNGFGTARDNEAITAILKTGVALRVCKGSIGGRAAAVFVFTFQEPAQGRKVCAAVRGHDEFAVVIGDVVFEKKLHFQSFRKDHWTFSKGSAELLWIRMVEIPERDVATIYRIAPLPGETLVVYRDSLVTCDLGIQVSRSESRLRHPDPAVFASVGPFSLAFRRGEPYGTKPAFDRIGVFEDKALPIPVPVVEEDEGSLDTRYEVFDREPWEGPED